MEKKNIVAIVGSASAHSSNHRLVDHFRKQTRELFDVFIYDDLKLFPHFNPEKSMSHPPQKILELRERIDAADGVLICTPEYIFSIPSGLKNILEWCVASTVFSKKPVGIISASANGQKGLEELQLILNTLDAVLDVKTTMLIQGIKAKFDQAGQWTDDHTHQTFMNFMSAFNELVSNNLR